MCVNDTPKRQRTGCNLSDSVLDKILQDDCLLCCDLLTAHVDEFQVLVDQLGISCYASGDHFV
jgi:hypothetical protein